PSIAEAPLMMMLTRKAEITEGVNRPAMLAKVQWPSTSWKAPTSRLEVGSSKNSRAKSVNGPTPIAVSTLARDSRAGERPPSGAATPLALTMDRCCRLLHVGADDRIPLLGDDVLRLAL